MRRATTPRVTNPTTGDISIHALHEESDLDRVIHQLKVQISIHALHEESDRSLRLFVHRLNAISIHALHEESDPS